MPAKEEKVSGDAPQQLSDEQAARRKAMQKARRKQQARMAKNPIAAARMQAMAKSNKRMKARPGFKAWAPENVGKPRAHFSRWQGGDEVTLARSRPSSSHFNRVRAAEKYRKENNGLVHRLEDIYNVNPNSFVVKNKLAKGEDCRGRWARRTSHYRNNPRVKKPASACGRRKGRGAGGGGSGSASGAGAGSGAPQKGKKGKKASKAATLRRKKQRDELLTKKKAIEASYKIKYKRANRRKTNVPKTAGVVLCSGCGRKSFFGADGPRMQRAPGGIYYCSDACRLVDWETAKATIAGATTGRWAYAKPSEAYWVTNNAALVVRKLLRLGKKDRPAAGRILSTYQALRKRELRGDAARAAKEPKAEDDPFDPKIKDRDPVDLLEEALLDSLRQKGGASVRRHLQKMFAQFDSDASGEISRSEFAEGVRDFMQGVPDAAVHRLFERFDADASGHVSLSEFSDRLVGDVDVGARDYAQLKADAAAARSRKGAMEKFAGSNGETSKTVSGGGKKRYKQQDREPLQLY